MKRYIAVLALAFLSVVEVTLCIGECEDARALAKAETVCQRVGSGVGCPDLVRGTVIGGYDDGSSVLPMRHTDVRLSGGATIHLSSRIAALPPRVGDPVVLEYWKGALVAWSLPNETINTRDHPAVRSAVDRGRAWFLAGLAVLFFIWLSPPARIPDSGDVRLPTSIGASRRFFLTVVTIVANATGAPIVASALDGLLSGLQHGALILLVAALPLIGALTRRVSLTDKGISVRRWFIPYTDMRQLGVRSGRTLTAANRFLEFTTAGANAPIVVDTLYWGAGNRSRLIRVVTHMAPQLEPSASARAIRDGGWSAPEDFVTSPWQGQSRGCATSLVGAGAVLLVVGLLVQSLGGPAWLGVLMFDSGALLLGVGIHRNGWVIRRYFGRRWGPLINVVQFLVPFIAIALDFIAVFVDEPVTSLALKMLSTVPFVLLWLLVWVPLSRISDRPAVDGESIGRLG